MAKIQGFKEVFDCDSNFKFGVFKVKMKQATSRRSLLLLIPDLIGSSSVEDDFDCHHHFANEIAEQSDSVNECDSTP